MKVLITGNSLTVPLREAWQAIAGDHPEIELDFFVAPHKVFMSLETDEAGAFGLAEADAKEGHARNWVERLNKRLSVRLTDYDVILAVGMQFGIGPMLKTMANYRVDGLETVHAGDRLMSREAFLALHDDIIARDLDWLSGFPAARTIVIPGSRAAEGVSQHEGPAEQLWATIEAAEADVGATLDLLDRRVSEAAEERGLTPILQPPETLTARRLSRPEYAGGKWLGSGRKRAKPAKRDHFHLNAEFGRCLWKPILAEIARRSG